MGRGAAPAALDLIPVQPSSRKRHFDSLPLSPLADTFVHACSRSRTKTHTKWLAEGYTPAKSSTTDDARHATGGFTCTASAMVPHLLGSE
eukprot:1119087-Pleurochrysis_carterae.AAC.1